MQLYKFGIWPFKCHIHVKILLGFDVCGIQRVTELLGIVDQWCSVIGELKWSNVSFKVLISGGVVCGIWSWWNFDKHECWLNWSVIWHCVKYGWCRRVQNIVILPHSVILHFLWSVFIFAQRPYQICTVSKDRFILAGYFGWKVNPNIRHVAGKYGRCRWIL